MPTKKVERWRCFPLLGKINGLESESFRLFVAGFTWSGEKKSKCTVGSAEQAFPPSTVWLVGGVQSVRNILITSRLKGHKMILTFKSPNTFGPVQSWIWHSLARLMITTQNVKLLLIGAAFQLKLAQVWTPDDTAKCGRCDAKPALMWSLQVACTCAKTQP